MLPAYAIFNPITVDEHIWYPDSAAASHMTSDDGKLLSKSVYSGNKMVKVGDGNRIFVVHTDTSGLSSRTKPLTLKNVLHVFKL